MNVWGKECVLFVSNATNIVCSVVFIMKTGTVFINTVKKTWKVIFLKSVKCLMKNKYFVDCLKMIIKNNKNCENFFI